MGILARILGYLPLIPSIVQGIQAIHGNAVAGADKKTLAMESLGLATAVTDTVAPEFKAEADAASQLASTTIDAVVKAFNDAGWAGHTVPVMPAAPAPPIAQP